MRRTLFIVSFIALFWCDTAQATGGWENCSGTSVSPAPSVDSKTTVCWVYTAGDESGLFHVIASATVNVKGDTVGIYHCTLGRKPATPSDECGLVKTLDGTYPSGASFALGAGSYYLGDLSGAGTISVRGRP